MELKMH